MIACTQCRDLLVERADGLIDDEALANEIDQHVVACPECRGEYEQVAALRGRMLSHAQMFASADVAEAVTTRLRKEPQQTQGHWVVRYCLRVGLGLSAAAAMILAIIWLSIGTNSVNAAEILADAAKAVADLHAVHITAQMRTVPYDNFELIVLNGEMVPIEMWKRFGHDEAWRVEKPGRVVVMDGANTTLLIKPDNAIEVPPAPDGGGLVGWIGNLMDVDKVLENEIALAKRQGSTLTTRQLADASGKQQLEVVVEAKAQGKYDPSGWLRNSSVSDSDNRRVYHFDPQTKRLLGLDVYVHTQPKDVLVFAITKIEYNPDLGDTTFSVALPEDVHWIESPKAPLPDKFAKMGPEEIARAFFEAISEQRWDDAQTLFPVKLNDRTKQVAAGLQVISIGKPFKSALYPGVFVPYEIRFAFGETKKFNLALRNDNPAKRWTVDGGF